MGKIGQKPENWYMEFLSNIFLKEKRVKEASLTYYLTLRFYREV